MVIWLFRFKYLLVFCLKKREIFFIIKNIRRKLLFKFRYVIIYIYWVYLSIYWWVVVGLCLGGVVYCSIYFFCIIVLDCLGICYFKLEWLICGVEVIDGCLVWICVCVG